MLDEKNDTFNSLNTDCLRYYIIDFLTVRFKAQYIIKHNILSSNNKKDLFHRMILKKIKNK